VISDSLAKIESRRIALYQAVLLALAVALLIASVGSHTTSAAEPPAIWAGFAEADITPKLADDRPVWLAGYGPGRKATGVHDPLMARAVVVSDSWKKVALICTDLVGLQRDTILSIRERLKGFDYVMVSSTHNHEGPDVIGLWGRTFVHRGVDDEYLATVVDRIVDAVERADRSAVPVEAHFGTAEDETLLRDSREPYVIDGVLRAIRFNRRDDGRVAGLLVQWNCHPESLGSKNTLISADFPGATVAALKERYDAPVVYLSGAVGGLMAPPRGRIKDDEGRELKVGDFEYTHRYGEAVADLAAKALDAAEPIELAPLSAESLAIAVPIENPYYRLAWATGVVRRKVHAWTGDYLKAKPIEAADALDRPTAVATEVAVLRLGQLHVACIPGELYPELVYGHVVDPAEEGADFPDAPAEPSVAEILPGKKWMLIGLANDEIGYIIPKRQWDNTAPFAYGRKSGQYGEINSCGPSVAPIVMQALKQCAARMAEK